MESIKGKVSNEHTNFFDLESNVKSYCRNFPVTFIRAQGEFLFDNEGNEYIDWFSAAGSLNYGHNDADMVARIIQYLGQNGIMQSLDLHTGAKHDFIKTFNNLILKPRNLSYKLAFSGPTGTNAVELALKFARKYTNRTTIVAFTNAFHGMTLGSLALAGRKSERNIAAQMPGVFRMPFDGYCGEAFNSLEYFEKLLLDQSSGLNLPAAVIVETIQAEGGVNVANAAWLKQLDFICKTYQIPLIIDDIQTGCGRTGNFFSFEEAGIEPEIVCLSKSLSGIGLPLSLVLVKNELDVLSPGEHNGTFRGNNLAFITAACAIEKYWSTPDFTQQIAHKHLLLKNKLVELAKHSIELNSPCKVKGRGLLLGLEWNNPDIASRISKVAFANKLFVETCGPNDNVLKFLPPLNIHESSLHKGMKRLEESIEQVLMDAL